MEMEYSISTLLSIFKRKGGEGKYTKIVYNTSESISLLDLNENEKELINCCFDRLNWVVLTNLNVISCQNDRIVKIKYLDIKRILPAFKKELEQNNFSKNQFSFIEVIDVNKNENIIRVEPGKPYEGVFQMLHYISVQRS